MAIASHPWIVHRGAPTPGYAVIRPPRYGHLNFAPLIGEEMGPTRETAAVHDDNSVRSSFDPGVAVPSAVRAQATLDDDGELARSYGFGAFDADGSPITWRTRQPITVALDPRGMAYSQFVRDAAHAIKTINFVGAFNLRLIGHDGGRLDEAQILIRWARFSSPSGPGLDRRVAATTVTTTGAAGRRTIRQAVVRLSVQARKSEGFVAGGWGVTLLHELMHALGAGHCNDAQQIMFWGAPAVADLGVGDRYCLRMLAEVARRRGGAEI